ncbi:hemolysin family protein [Jeotgalibaca sp. MA1X17-3]|uniref:hemolysin family protein n=1 Tax=Jeotgalibaca sp. MA1X17-3 TaxID=2908211 RepID=UPI001F33E11C|nr:hemolysin family protein [Jeotgalibaca sp. MA1X17-3]UJF15198.1 hemolysin family protein [Jeotgalibaca sp. MA1X17-3]
MKISTGLFLFFFILLIASFFVMAEYVLVRIRPSRLNFLIENGNLKAKKLKEMTMKLDSYLSATQLGVTITSLALGWLGDPTFKRIFDNLFDQFTLPKSVSTILSFFVSFTILTSIQVIVGELVPKNIAITKTEKLGLKIAGPLSVWYRVMYPLIFILNKTANGISKAMGFATFSESDDRVSEEELRMIMSESLKSGEINHEEYQFVENVFNFDERMAREIMIPRTEMATVWSEDTLDDIADKVRAEKYTRYPVIENDKDNILGVINTKEIFAAYVEAVRDQTTSEFIIQDYIRPVITVIETLPIKDLLVKMQREHNQIAILMDEYGGTSGLVSMEDIVEEIVGDISDDFETEYQPEFIKLGTDHYRITARMLIDDVNDLFGLKIEEENVDTIGGWMLNEKYDIQVGDEIDFDKVIFKVIQKQKNTLLLIDIFIQESHQKKDEPTLESTTETKNEE